MLKLKKQIIIALVVFAIVVIVYWVYNQFKGDGPADVPDDNVTAPSTEAEDLIAVNLAANLYSEMSAWKLGANAQPFEELAQLSDRRLVLVYNAYLDMYDDNLRDRLENGWFLTWGSLYSLIMDVIIPRMDKLGLM